MTPAPAADSVQNLLLSGLLLYGRCESEAFTRHFTKVLSIGNASPLRAKCPSALVELIRSGKAVSTGKMLRVSLSFHDQFQLAKTSEFRVFAQYYDQLAGSDFCSPGVLEYRALMHAAVLTGNAMLFDSTLNKACENPQIQRKELVEQVCRELFRKGLPSAELLHRDFIPRLFAGISARCFYFGEAPQSWLKAGLHFFQKDSLYNLDLALLAWCANDREALKQLTGTLYAREFSAALTLMLDGKSREASEYFMRTINSLERTLQTCPETVYAIALLNINAVETISSKRWRQVFLKNSVSVLKKEIDELFNILSIFGKTPQFEPESEFIEPDKTHSAFTRLLALKIQRFTAHGAFPEERLKSSIQQASKLLDRGAISLGTLLVNAISEISSGKIELKTPTGEPTEPVPVWRSALAQLSGAAGISLNKDPVGQDFISWHISVTGKEVLRIMDIAVRRHRSGTDPASGGMQVSPGRVRDGELDFLLSPLEQKIKDCVKKQYGSQSWMIEHSAVKYLVRSKFVFLNSERIELSAGRFPLNIRRMDDGTLQLAAPAANLDSLNGLFLTKQAHQVSIVEPDEKSASILRTIRNFGKEGVLSFPKESENELCQVLSGLSGKVDLQGDLPQKLTETLEKEEVSPVPAVRISQTNDGMRFEIRTVSSGGGPSVQIPGEGTASRIINGVLTVRDLAQERNCAGQVLTNCPSLELCEKAGPYVYESESPAVNLSVLGELQDSGITTEFVNLKRITLLPPAGTELSFDEDDEKWLDIGGEIKLDEDHILPLSELLESFGQGNGPFVRINENKWVRLQGELKNQLELLKNGEVLSNGKVRLPEAALTAVAETFGNVELPPVFRLKVENIRKAFETEYPVPENLNAVLRSYQLTGYRYLRKMSACGTGCCLADDMGLGKTIQLLSFLLAESEQGPSLVVAPASVCGNWAAETARFAPSLHVIRPGTSNREALLKKAGAGDLVIASYGLVTSEKELFSECRWHAVILDEAQAIKNNLSRRTQAVKALKARIRFAATGTPVENKLSELWSLFDFLTPGLLGSEQNFAAKFTANGMPSPGLKRLVSPLILRRVKKDVLRDLPEKSEIVQSVDLSETERSLYESIRRDFKEKLHRTQGNRIEILAALMKLRRLCCHPSLVFERPPECGAKLERVLELAETLSSAGHRTLIFSQFTDFLALIRNAFDKQEYRYLYLDGSTPAKQRTELVDEFQKGGHDFFLISLKAGGVGLNLTSADYVIITDSWWNPAVEDQAADRAHRIGQKNPVTVYRLITTGTVEEKVIRLHEKKRALAEDILGGTGGENITQDDLLDLFAD